MGPSHSHLHSKFALAYHNWGSVLLAQKKYDEAIAKYQKAIELDPKFASSAALQQLGRLAP